MAKTRKVSHHKKQHIKRIKNVKRTHKRSMKLVKKRKTRKNTKKRKMKGGGIFDTIKGFFMKKKESEPSSVELPEPEVAPEPEPIPEPVEEKLEITVTEDELNKKNAELQERHEEKIRDLEEQIEKDRPIAQSQSGLAGGEGNDVEEAQTRIQKAEKILEELREGPKLIGSLEELQNLKIKKNKQNLNTNPPLEVENAFVENAEKQKKSVDVKTVF